MPKVEIEVMATKTVEYSVTKEVDVPKSVLDEDRLFEWLEEDKNQKIWQGADANDIEEHDESYTLNEANVLD